MTTSPTYSFGMMLKEMVKPVTDFATPNAMLLLPGACATWTILAGLPNKSSLPLVFAALGMAYGFRMHGPLLAKNVRFQDRIATAAGAGVLMGSLGGMI